MEGSEAKGFAKNSGPCSTLYMWARKREIRRDWLENEPVALENSRPPVVSPLREGDLDTKTNAKRENSVATK